MQKKIFHIKYILFAFLSLFIYKYYIILYIYKKKHNKSEYN